MRALEQSNKINADIKNWPSLTGEQRAYAVLDWALHNGVDSGSVTARPLAEAMRRQKYLAQVHDKYSWEQGPDDYLDMLKSIVAYLATRV